MCKANGHRVLVPLTTRTVFYFINSSSGSIWVSVLTSENALNRPLEKVHYYYYYVPITEPLFLGLWNSELTPVLEQQI